MLELNTANLHKVVQDFHTLTRIHTVLFDAEYTKIAYTPAFSDYDHFSRIFKKQTGTSARSYRKA